MTDSTFQALDQVLAVTAPIIAMRWQLIDGGFSPQAAEVIVHELIKNRRTA